MAPVALKWRWAVGSRREFRSELVRRVEWGGVPRQLAGKDSRLKALLQGVVAKVRVTVREAR